MLPPVRPELFVVALRPHPRRLAIGKYGVHDAVLKRSFCARLFIMVHAEVMRHLVRHDRAGVRRRIVVLVDGIPPAL